MALALGVLAIIATAMMVWIVFLVMLGEFGGNRRLPVRTKPED
jgi:hypothetical protein